MAHTPERQTEHVLLQDDLHTLFREHADKANVLRLNAAVLSGKAAMSGTIYRVSVGDIYHPQTGQVYCVTMRIEDDPDSMVPLAVREQDTRLLIPGLPILEDDDIRAARSVIGLTVWEPHSEQPNERA